ALNAESWRILLAPLISPSRLPTATSFSVSAEQSWATARAAAVVSSICAHSTVATLAKQASRASYASWILGVCQRSPTLKKLPSHALSSNTCDDSSTRDAKADRMRGPCRKRVHQACMVGCVQTESADNLAQPRLLHFARPTRRTPSQPTGARATAFVRTNSAMHPLRGSGRAVWRRPFKLPPEARHYPAQSDPAGTTCCTARELKAAPQQMLERHQAGPCRSTPKLGERPGRRDSR